MDDDTYGPSFRWFAWRPVFTYDRGSGARSDRRIGVAGAQTPQGPVLSAQD